MLRRRNNLLDWHPTDLASCARGQHQTVDITSARCLGCGCLHRLEVPIAGSTGVRFRTNTTFVTRGVLELQFLLEASSLNSLLILHALTLLYFNTILGSDQSAWGFSSWNFTGETMILGGEDHSFLWFFNQSTAGGAPKNDGISVFSGPAVRQLIDPQARELYAAANSWNHWGKAWNWGIPGFRAWCWMDCAMYLICNQQKSQDWDTYGCFPCNEAGFVSKMEFAFQRLVYLKGAVGDDDQMWLQLLSLWARW